MHVDINKLTEKNKSKCTKKPQSAWIIYIKENREKVKQKNPEIENNNIFKAMSDEWKFMSDADKKPYNNKSKIDKARYKKEKKEYEETKI